MANYYDAVVASNAYSLLGVCLFFLLIFVLINAILSKRKTYKYRKALTDMYVAAKIRKLAQEDNLDLASEYESFKKWEKKRKLENENYQLDDVVEEELKERVSDSEKKKK